MTKYCEDCKHFRESEVTIFRLAKFVGAKAHKRWGRCAKFAEYPTQLDKAITLISPQVAAPVLEQIYYCSVARSGNNLCGLDAKSFEPKEA